MKKVVGLITAFTVILFLPVPGWAKLPNYQHCGLNVSLERQRDLEAWKPQIAAYSLRHYGEDTWKLKPQAIVMHYTAGANFPWNLVRSQDFANETPGLGVQYVVDGTQIWEVLPPNIRARGAYGINHRAISIEMVALDAQDLSENRQKTLETSAELVRCLLKTYRIPQRQIYSHAQVATMDPQIVPFVEDLIDAAPYSKIDPGEENMAYLMEWLNRH